MSIFDLDPAGAQQLDEQARLNPLDLSKQQAGFFTGMFQGLGEGIMRGGAKAGSLPALAAEQSGNDYHLSLALANPDTDVLRPLPAPFAPRHDAFDAYHRNVDFWTPGPGEVGTAGNVLGGLGEMVLPLAAGGGNPALLASSETVGTTLDLQRQGVDPQAAVDVGAMQGASVMVGFSLPAAIGRNPITRLATGVAGNLLVGRATGYGQQARLNASGDTEAAKQFDPWNAQSVVLDVLMGAAFGGVAHLHQRGTDAMPLPRDMTQAERDAVLTANNADHFANQTMPGTPTTPGAVVAHQRALETAIEQALRGEPVDVAGKVDLGQFELRPELRDAPVDPVDANPAGQALRQRLVSDPEQLFRDYAALPDSKGGRVLNTDTARELSPEYLADRTRSADVHEPASDTIKQLYAKKLAEPTPEGFDRSVLFTAGGTGAGKTTAVDAMKGVDRPPELVYDTNMNTYASAERKVQQALDAGRDVSILYVYRDPVEALTGGALPRAERQAKKFGSGRTVPLAEHAKTHLGVRDVIERLAEKYKDNPRVDIRAYDNSRGKDAGAFVDLANIPLIDQNGLHERLASALEAEHQAGRISDATRAGFDNPGRDAQGVQRSPVQAHRRELRTHGAPGRGPQGLDPQAFPVQGDASTVITERGMKLPVRWAVVDASTLVTSHDDALHVNPAFPAELQPRDRTRAASEQQIARIANDVKPELLAESPKAADGAPVVGADRVVESGNARTIALRRAYANGKADAYRQFIIDNAARFGIDPTQLGGGFERSLNDPPKPGEVIHVVRLASPGRESLADSNAANVDGATYLLGKQDDMESSVGVPDNAVLTVWAVTVPDKVDGYQPIMGEVGRGTSIGADHFGRGKAMRADADSIWYSFGSGIKATKVGQSIPLAEIRAAKQAALGDRLFTYSVQDTEWLRSFIESQTQTIRDPVLVRVTEGDYNRSEFARQANESTVAAMSSTEQALADARHLPDMGDLHTRDDGSINMRASAKFVHGFIEGVGPNERGAMSTADGELSQQGQARIRNAVFARAYGDAELVAMMAEATDANVKNVLAGMLRAAPEVARLREMIAEGGRFGPDITPDLVAAVRKFSQLRRDGTTVAQFEAQGDFFGEGGLSPRARELLRTVGENARAPKRMAEFLQRYVDAVHVLGDPRQADLLGGGKGDHADAALRQAGEATRAAHDTPAPQAGSLFNAAGRPTEGAKAAPAITPENRAAYEAIAAHPDLHIVDDEGRPVPAAEFLAAADAEAAAARDTTRGIEAAANCLLRNVA